MSWNTPRLGRVPGADAACTCDAQPRPHDAPYRVESVNEQTGEVRTAWLCPSRAAALAARYGLPFPPGMWDRP